MKTKKNDPEKTGLQDIEYEKICDLLNREPTLFELSVFSLAWKETGFQKINDLLKQLLSDGKDIVEESDKGKAEVFEINDDLAVASKIISHNFKFHANFYEGASVQAGRVLRSILSNYTLPSAILSSLYFEDNVNGERGNKIRVFINGINDYCNKTGIQFIGTEFCSDNYYSNPIVNIMSVGIIRRDNAKTVSHPDPGDKIYIFGAKTTNLLIKAFDEITSHGIAKGIKDIDPSGGIAGSLGALMKGNKNGVKIYLDRVPLQEGNRDPLQVLLSGTKDMMITVINEGDIKIIEGIFKKPDVYFADIGEITAENRLEIFNKSESLAKLPFDRLTKGSPLLNTINIQEEGYTEIETKTTDFSIDNVSEPDDLTEITHKLLNLPDVLSGKLIFHPEKSQPDADSLINESSFNAGIIDIEGSRIAVAFAIGCNAGYVFSDPETGTQIAVAETARKIICSGGVPLSISISLEFDNFDYRGVYSYFKRIIEGIQKVCRRFDIHLTSDNIKIRNQISADKKTKNIPPVPVIGMTGILKEKNNKMTHAFKSKGSMIYLIGKSVNDIASSQYLRNYHHIGESPPPVFDLEYEYKVQMVIKDLIKYSLVRSVHNISKGGLFVSLTESGIPRKLGFDITTPAEIRRDAFLFGEAQGRVVVTVASSYETEFIDFMIKTDVPFSTLGHVTKGDCRIDDISIGSISDILKDFDCTLEDIMKK